MKSYTTTTYKCEFCGKESTYRAVIEKCEAAHYGLTVEQKRKLDELRADCAIAGYIVSRTCNSETRKQFDEAVDRCLRFEQEHGILKQ